MIFQTWSFYRMLKGFIRLQCPPNLSVMLEHRLVKMRTAHHELAGIETHSINAIPN